MSKKQYLDFPCLPSDAEKDGKLRLNRYSSHITNEHDYPVAKVSSLLRPTSARLFSLIDFSL